MANYPQNHMQNRDRGHLQARCDLRLILLD